MTLFNLLSEKEKKFGKTVQLKKGQILFHESDRCEYVGLVTKGQIVISSYTLSGNEIIYNNIGVGDMFGNNLLFSSNPYYKGNVIAIFNSEIILFNKDNLLSIFQQNPAFLEEYLHFQAEFAKNLNHKLKILSFDSAEERLLYLLNEKKKIRIKSVSALAKELYLSRETLSRLITRLVDEGKISRAGNIVELL